MLCASLIVQVAITLAALASDPLIALWFDGLGGAFVAALQISIGVRMISESLPDLLDHAVPDKFRARVDELLADTSLGADDVRAVRTRRAGFMPHIEVSLAPADCTSIADFCRHADEVRAVLEDDLRSIEVGVTVATTGLGRIPQ